MTEPPSPPPGDVELACAGDRDALDRVFTSLVGRVRLFVGYRLGGHLRRRVDVDDVVQEAFLRASLDIRTRSMSSEAEVYRYMVQLARRTIVDIARAARAAHRDMDERPLSPADWSSSGFDVAGDQPGPYTRAALAETQRKLEDAFVRLSPRHRRIIALRQFEQLPASAIVGQVDCFTEVAVHGLYRRALTAWGQAVDTSS